MTGEIYELPNELPNELPKKNIFGRKKQASKKANCDDLSRRFLAELRPVLSQAGNHRSKPKLVDRSLKPLLDKFGFDPLMAAARAFYASPVATKDGGAYQPGLQVIANDGRLEAMVAHAAAARLKAERIFREHGYWDPSNGPEPSGSISP